MGFMDTIKGLVKGRERQVKGGIDSVSSKVSQTVGTKHASKVDAVSAKAKDAVDKLSRDDPPPTAPAPRVVASPAPAPDVDVPPPTV